MDALTDYLKTLETRLAAVEAATGTSAPAAAAGGSGGGGSGGDDSRSVRAYDAYSRQYLDPFIAAANALGAEGTTLGGLVQRAFACQRAFLVTAAECKKPAQTDTMKLLAGLREIFAEANSNIQRGDFENHQKAINEGLQALGWLCVEPAPRDYIESYIGGSDFWANKVRVAHKATGPAHIAFCTTFKALLTELIPYVKEHHMAGVVWNPRGNDVDVSAPANPMAAASKAAVAPAPAAVKASGGGAGAAPGGLNAVFAGIQAVDQSSGKTAGLRTVTKDMQTWRSEYKGGDAAAPAAPVKKAVAPRVANNTPKGPPKCELVSGRWLVENQTGIVTVDDIERRQAVSIYGCIGATIVLNGKAKTIAVDNCHKTKIVFDDAVSSIELVNCKRMQIQVRGVVPSVAIDKTDGCLTYLSEASMNCQFVTSKSSEMNVAYPRPGTTDDFIEVPIPEQFVHRVLPDLNKMSAEVSDLYA